MFRTNRICNPTVKLSKYKFINKLLGGVTLFINLFYLFILYIDYKIIDWCNSHPKFTSNSEIFQVTPSVILSNVISLNIF